MACYARNLEIGPHGFSPQQITFGFGSYIPGITDGNIATDSTITSSDAIREHFQIINDAWKAYLEADSSARLKLALKNRVHSFNDLVFWPGEKVFFRDEKEQWDGPAEVITSDGRTVWIQWHGNLRKAATSRLLKYSEDINGEEVNNDNKDETNKYSCQKCDFTTEQTSIMINHLKDVHEKTDFNCKQCDFKATQEDDLKMHDESAHKNTEFLCEQCDFKTIDES